MSRGKHTALSRSSSWPARFPPDIAFVDTMEMEDLRQSPSGFWYPGRVRRTTSNFKKPQPANFNGVQVWTYHLEFDVEMPDELFQALK